MQGLRRKPSAHPRPDGNMCRGPTGRDAQALHTAAPFVREVGDCIRPANITKAVYEGYHAALIFDCAFVHLPSRPII